ncbi:MAG: diaminopimelate epimerase [Pseudomonadota bacterium]
MSIRFTKMHGLGNDFVVFESLSRELYFTPETIRLLADRHRGIGFDQLLLITPPSRVDVDFGYRIFNHDGSEVAQCGNGARCVGRFIRDRKFSPKQHLVLETLNGILELYVADTHVTVNMGIPTFEPHEIPFIAEQSALEYDLDVSGEIFRVSAVALGNPHVVLVCESAANAPVTKLGRKIESHARFPQRVNVGFLEIMDPTNIRLRVYERGAGETQACGSGACAAAVIARRLGRTQEIVKVHLIGGDLEIRWGGQGSPIWMRGPTVSVFEGNLQPDLFRRSPV